MRLRACPNPNAGSLTSRPSAGTSRASAQESASRSVPSADGGPKVMKVQLVPSDLPASSTSATPRAASTGSSRGRGHRGRGGRRVRAPSPRTRGICLTSAATRMGTGQLAWRAAASAPDVPRRDRGGRADGQTRRQLGRCHRQIVLATARRPSCPSAAARLPPSTSWTHVRTSRKFSQPPESWPSFGMLTGQMEVAYESIA